ncbi:MAG TPA: hypothetical protein VJN94_10865 [Candidatus Binataceae bacterium]|nr:hypothetical protein [Candidatus Binataceae bacterium]
MSFFGPTLPNDVKQVITNAAGFISSKEPVVESALADLGAKAIPNLTSTMWSEIVKLFTQSTAAASQVPGVTEPNKRVAVLSAAKSLIGGQGINPDLLPVCLTNALMECGFVLQAAGITTTVPLNVEQAVMVAVQALPKP